jgi:prepilin-type N-terminal cleavage/methylation domain-containing protein
MRSHGFTIVELLVVIAVVGVVLAIALPALDQTRQRSQTAGCASNLRQIGLMINDYQAANHQRMPALVNRNSTSEPGPALDTLLTSPEQVDLFCCPSDTSIKSKTGTSYFWNPVAGGATLAQLFPENQRGVALPLLSDKQALHPELRDGMNILYAACNMPGQLNFTTPGK